MRRSLIAAITFIAVVFLTLLGWQAFASTTASDGSKCTIVGTAKNDVLKGTAGNDVICGLGGNDKITGLGGNDVIDGGSGNDIVDAGAGNDKIVADAGNDTLVGGAGTDLLTFQSTATGIAANLTKGTSSGVGADKINGFENLTGGSGNDTLTGDSAANAILGGPGNDLVLGGAGNDTISGGPGLDRLSGDSGKDNVASGLGTSACAIDLSDTSKCQIMTDKPLSTIAVVVGKISNHDGLGLPAVRVGFYADQAETQITSQALTDASGNYAVAAPLGQVRMNIKALTGVASSLQMPGFFSVGFLDQVTVQNSGRFDYTFPKAYALTFHVEDQDGSPVSGATLEYTSQKYFLQNISEPGVHSGTALMLPTSEYLGVTDCSTNATTMVTQASGDATCWLFATGEQTSPLAINKVRFVKKDGSQGSLDLVGLNSFVISANQPSDERQHLIQVNNLGPGFNVSGRITNAAGTAIPDMRITFTNEGGTSSATTFTDADGNYKVRANEGKVFINARYFGIHSYDFDLPPSFAVGGSAVFLKDGTLDLQLPSAYRQEIFLEDQDHYSIPGALLYLNATRFLSNPPIEAPLITSDATDTLSDTYVVQNLCLGALQLFSCQQTSMTANSEGVISYWSFATGDAPTWTLDHAEYTSSDHVTTRFTDLETLDFRVLEGASSTEPVTFHLVLPLPKNRVNLMGHIYNHEHQPVPNMRVTLSDSANSSVVTFTDSEGAYQVSSPLGTVHLSARYVGGPVPNLSLPPSFILGTTLNVVQAGSLEIVLPETYQQTVTVTDQNSQPLTGASVEFLTSRLLMQPPLEDFLINSNASDSNTDAYLAENLCAWGSNPFNCLSSSLTTDANGKAIFWVFAANNSDVPWQIVSLKYTDAHNLSYNTSVTQNNILVFAVGQPPSQLDFTLRLLH